MPVLLENIVLFRIVHINNVEYILRNGMFLKESPHADPDYINIGDTILIEQRNDYPVKLEGYGTLGEYIPFYFGPLSPMLLNIKTGYRGITKRPQSEIAYICCSLRQIFDNCSEWCFTDGHAKNKFTGFYKETDDLEKIDWNIVNEHYWQNTEDDNDRMRRKQAEFLVKNHVPPQCIEAIIVYNIAKKNSIQEIIEKINPKIRVLVNPKGKFYYE